MIDLREVERGKYFRLVAEVIADGENMSDVLLERGLAWPYDGGTRERPFCTGGKGEKRVVLSVVDWVMLPTINAYLLAMGHTE